MFKFLVTSGDMERVVTAKDFRAAAVKALEAEAADQGRPLAVLTEVTLIDRDPVYTGTVALLKKLGRYAEKGVSNGGRE